MATAKISNTTTEISFQLQLLREKSEINFRNLFHKNFPIKDPTKLTAELQKHQGTLEPLLKKKILKQNQCPRISLL